MRIPFEEVFSFCGDLELEVEPEMLANCKGALEQI